MPTTRINISISQWCWAIDARVVAFYRLTPLAYIATLRLHKLLLTGLMAHTHRYTRWGARTGTRAPYRITSIHIHISFIEAKCLGACLHCAERQRHITKWPQPHCYWPNNFECHYAINCSRSLLRYIYTVPCQTMASLNNTAANHHAAHNAHTPIPNATSRKSISIFHHLDRWRLDGVVAPQASIMQWLLAILMARNTAKNRTQHIRTTREQHTLHYYFYYNDGPREFEQKKKKRNDQKHLEEWEKIW